MSIKLHSFNEFQKISLEQPVQSKVGDNVDKRNFFQNYKNLSKILEEN